MLKKTLISIASTAALIGAFAAPAYAASTFYLMVPLVTRTQAPDPVEAITVSLAGAALPKATIDKAYSETLRPYLSATGDAGFDPAAARWALSEGALPAGLVLNETTGAVSGTPTAKTASPASFTVLATYKGENGQAVYTIEVDGEVLNVSTIATGNAHTCAITEAGSVKCWGFNNFGQLGDNTTTTRLKPVDVVGLSSGAASLSAGLYQSCVVMSSGAAKCWGINDYGQLGDGSLATRLSPVDVPSLGSNVVRISTGYKHTCAVTKDGAALCWGLNSFGQLGDSSTTNRTTPVAVTGLPAGVASIATGYSHTCAVLNSGAAKCWGANSYGQLGDNSAITRSSPVDVSDLGFSVASLATGDNHTCAVTTSGAALCWGRNDFGQLGNNSVANQLKPASVYGLGAQIASISASTEHSCAVTEDGAAKCWGRNTYGRLGDGTTTQRNVPVAVSGMSAGVKSISTAATFTCAMTTSGAAKCWGRNYYGQLGDNTTTQRLTPVNVVGLQ